MRPVTREAMQDGAFGVATALIYPPNAFSTTDELVAVMEVVAEYNGVHITHMRSEGDRILDGLAETIEIAERSGVATEIYHLKAAGRDNWPMMDVVIDRDQRRPGPWSRYHRRHVPLRRRGHRP